MEQIRDLEAAIDPCCCLEHPSLILIDKSITPAHIFPCNDLIECINHCLFHLLGTSSSNKGYHYVSCHEPQSRSSKSYLLPLLVPTFAREMELEPFSGS